MKKAIIIGAGPAGLTAAFELLSKTDIIPIIIEADSQVGGISKTINYKNNRIDIGGHRFFSKSNVIINWWLRFLSLESVGNNAPVNITYQNKTKTLNEEDLEPGSAIPDMLIRKRKSRIYYRKSFFDYPLRLNLHLMQNLGLVKMCRIGASYIWSRSFPRKPENTLADFFRNRFGSELYNTFFKDYTEKVWGVKCDDLPASWGYQRIKNLNISKAIKQTFKSLFSSNTSITQKGVSTSLIEQFLYPKYGPGQMWETVAAEIVKRGGEIHLSTEVILLSPDNSNKIKHVTVKDRITKEEKTIAGDFFISTMPVKDLINGFRQPLPDNRIIKLASELEYRDFIIAGLLINTIITEPGMPDAALKDNWIYLQDHDIKAGRLQVFNNWSPFMVNDPKTTWIGVEYFCNENDEFWQKDEQQIADIAKSEIERIGLIKQKQVIDYKVIKVPKAYPSYTGSYDKFDEIKDYLNQFSNLYLVGRNGMHRYNNTDHSMMTAILAVENIINNREDKSNIWAVNMEDDYHEENN